MKMFIEIEKSEKGWGVAFYNDCNKLVEFVDGFDSWSAAWDYAVAYKFPDSIAGYNDFVVSDKRKLVAIRNIESVAAMWRGMLGELLGEIPNYPNHFNVIININGKDHFLVFKREEFELLG